jgi:hypothetical protein
LFLFDEFSVCCRQKWLNKTVKNPPTSPKTSARTDQNITSNNTILYQLSEKNITFKKQQKFSLLNGSADFPIRINVLR